MHNLIGHVGEMDGVLEYAAACDGLFFILDVLGGVTLRFIFIN